MPTKYELLQVAKKIVERSSCNSITCNECPASVFNSGSKCSDKKDFPYREPIAWLKIYIAEREVQEIPLKQIAHKILASKTCVGVDCDECPASESNSGSECASKRGTKKSTDPRVPIQWLEKYLGRTPSTQDISDILTENEYDIQKRLLV